MTEEEAKTKWCPFARGEQHSGGNRAPYGSPGDGPVEEDYTSEMAMRYPCIGSACMAWRSLEVYDDRERHLYSRITGKRVSGGTDDDTEWRLVDPDEPPPAPRGYCGLAGKS